MISGMIRAATVNDVAEIRAMIRELAEYERAAEQAQARRCSTTIPLPSH